MLQILATVVTKFMGVDSEDNKENNEQLRFELDLAREHLFKFLAPGQMADAAFKRL